MTSTKENFGKVISTCSPGYPKSAKDKFLAGWVLPLVNSSIVLAHSKSPSFLQIRGSAVICVLESDRHFQIVALEVFKKTATDEGLPEAVQLETYSKLARLLAERGYADVAYVIRISVILR